MVLVRLLGEFIDQGAALGQTEDRGGKKGDMAVVVAPVQVDALFALAERGEGRGEGADAPLLIGLFGQLTVGGVCAADAPHIDQQRPLQGVLGVLRLLLKAVQQGGQRIHCFQVFHNVTANFVIVHSYLSPRGQRDCPAGIVVAGFLVDVPAQLEEPRELVIHLLGVAKSGVGVPFDAGRDVSHREAHGRDI